MTKAKEYHLGKAFKTLTGERCIVYRPDLDKTAPWVSYYKGKAGVYFPTLLRAKKYHSFNKTPLIITPGN